MSHRHDGYTEAKVQARVLLKEYRSTEPAKRFRATERLRSHPYLADRLDEGDVNVQLSHALYVVASERGFVDWEAMASSYRTPVDTDLLTRVEALCGIYARMQGHTDDDVTRVLGTMSEWTGHDLVCVWDAFDMYGCGGNSEHGVRIGKRVYGCPDAIWQYLWYDEDESDVAIDPRALRKVDIDKNDVLSPNADGQYAREVTPDRNLAWEIE